MRQLNAMASTSRFSFLMPIPKPHLDEMLGYVGDLRQLSLAFTVYVTHCIGSKSRVDIFAGLCKQAMASGV